MQRRILLASVLICAPGVAGAGEACISCETPHTVYRCDIEKSEQVEKYVSAEEVVPRVCVQALTKLGGHGSCQAVAPADGRCEGTVKTLGLADLQKAAMGGSRDSVVPSLGERAGNAAQSAGDKIGSAFKKSWNCLASLFQECS